MNPWTTSKSRVETIDCVNLRVGGECGAIEGSIDEALICACQIQASGMIPSSRLSNVIPAVRGGQTLQR